MKELGTYASHYLRRAGLASILSLQALQFTACADDGDSDTGSGGQDSSGDSTTTSGTESTSSDSSGSTGGPTSGSTESSGSVGSSGDGSSEASEASSETGDSDCETRAGGAMIDFQINEQTLRVWVTNAAFITEAKRLLAAGERRNPHFSTILAGQDCDAQWSWHFDSDDVSWADLSIEVCDGRPSDLEDDLDYWMNKVGEFCPWAAEVVAVDERE